jgi:hypothetical protein
LEGPAVMDQALAELSRSPVRTCQVSLDRAPTQLQQKRERSVAPPFPSSHAETALLEIRLHLADGRLLYPVPRQM